MAADDLVTEGARASAAMLLTWCPREYSVLSIRRVKNCIYFQVSVILIQSWAFPWYFRKNEGGQLTTVFTTNSLVHTSGVPMQSSVPSNGQKLHTTYTAFSSMLGKMWLEDLWWDGTEIINWKLTGNKLELLKKSKIKMQTILLWVPHLPSQEYFNQCGFESYSNLFKLFAKNIFHWNYNFLPPLTWLTA